MSIRDVEKINSLQMDALKRKQSHEISRMNEGQEILKSELKKANQEELVDLRNENDRYVASENDKKEKVLEQMKTHLNQTTKMTDSQIKDLKINAENVKKTEREKLSAERDRVKSENDLYLEDLGYRFSKEFKKVSNDNAEQLRQLKDDKGQEITETEGRLQAKLNDQTNNFTERFQEESKNQKIIKDNQEKQFKNQRLNTNTRQQQEMSKLTNGHNQFLEVRDTTFRKGIKEQDLMFEKKYSESLKIRNDDLKRLEDLNSKVLVKMKTDLKETLETSVKRSDDPFYRFTQLNPTLKQFEDHVEIKVKVPDHAKTEILLTIHDKEAILNFNRRYDDSRVEEGVNNKLHKVESFTTRLLTNHHLDPKSVKSKYEDGVMTYTINRS